MTQPIAYLMENDEAKWLGWEPDPQADFATPLYKEKWKMTKDKGTSPTPEGYCVEPSTEIGSVQIYPAAALEKI